MAYRRRQGITRASTFKEETYHLPHTHDDGPPTDFQDHDNVSSYSSSSSSSSSSDSLAARAIRASAAHRDSSAYGYAYAAPTADSFSSSAASPLHRDFNILSGSKGQVPLESSSVKNQDESKYGLWGILARKAKAILENETDPQQFGGPNRMRSQTTDASPGGQFYQQQSPESGGKIESPRLRKGLDAITSSLNHIGDTIGNALEEGRAIVEHKTADILQETRKLQSRRKGLHSETRNQSFNLQNSWQQPGTHPIQVPVQSNHETQLKASRDVAMATAAKAKLLLRELKTTKADLAFAKERCAQLEEENKRLRESKEKSGNNSNADDDLIRLQLETLLAEKARLAHENSIYARENRFLREIVEYHQLTMQDLIYLDEGSEEVSEVYPRASVDDDKGISSSPTSPTSPPVDVLLHDITPPSCPPPENKEYTAAEIFLSGCAPDKKERLELEATNLKRDCVNQQRSETSSISRLVIPMSEDTKRPPAVSPSQVWIG